MSDDWHAEGHVCEEIEDATTVLPAVGSFEKMHKGSVASSFSFASQKEVLLGRLLLETHSWQMWSDGHNPNHRILLRPSNKQKPKEGTCIVHFDAASSNCIGWKGDASHLPNEHLLFTFVNLHESNSTTERAFN